MTKQLALVPPHAAKVKVFAQSSPRISLPNTHRHTHEQRNNFDNSNIKLQPHNRKANKSQLMSHSVVLLKDDDS